MVLCAPYGLSFDDDRVKVWASIDKTKVQVAKTVTLTISAQYPRNYQIRFPLLSVDIDGLFIESVEKSEPLKVDPDMVFVKKKYRLNTFVPGPYVIRPKIFVAVDPEGEFSEYKTPELFIDVVSLIGVDDTDIRDIKGPVEASMITLIVLGGIVLALLVFGVWWWLRSKKSKEEMKGVDLDPRPIHERALEELKRLEDSGLLEEDLYKEFYSGVSDIVRHYIEGRFSLNAPEQTTQEFLEATSRTHVITYEHRKLLQEFMSECDLVKFARFRPRLDEANHLLVQAREFIRSTIPDDPGDGPKKDLHKDQRAYYV
ncbi:hypothetical protein IIB34_06625 [PVC group bacterium]|nr:hypothetical protein [PVC group bacterium]